MATREDVERVLKRVNRGSDLAFFFDQLTSPEWIAALQEAGLFSAPPGPEVEGDFVRYPSWAATRYLVRVAPDAPAEVLAVLLELPESENPRIHEDIAEAASAMPVENAVRLVPSVRRWLDTDAHLLLLPDKVADLIERLLASGAVDEALRLAEGMFGVADDQEVEYGQRVITRLREHDYVEFLGRLGEPLTAAGGAQAVSLFVSLLDGVLRSRRSDPADGDSPFDDVSTIWRSDVTDTSDQHSRFEPVLNALVDASYLGAKGLEDAEFTKAVLELERAGAKIFRRVLLQLVSDESSRFDPDMLRRLVVDPEALGDGTLELEYLRALSASATRLSLSDRERLTQQIRNGPQNREFLAGRLGNEWQQYLRNWQARRIAALGEATPADDKEWAHELMSGFDDSELLPSRPATGATWVGPTSPRTAEQLLSASIEEVTAFLRTWKPSGEWAAPSPEGLGRSLAAAVVEQPERFTASAADFVGLDPVYVRSLLAGARDALKGDAEVAWGSLLELCEWVVSQDRRTMHPNWAREDRDPGWDWTWTEIARLIEQGLTERPSRVPDAMAARVENLLLRLVTHPDPTPEAEDQYGGTNMDPSSLSINTTRGEATHALLRFAWWTKKVLLQDQPSAAVRGALERLMDSRSEPSVAVHSAFGRWFGTIAWLDRQWAASVVGRIFPPEPEKVVYWWAAWSAFVVFDRPTTAAHELLRDEYRRALNVVGDDNETLYFRAGRDHAEALAGHLLPYFVWGVDADPQEGLVRDLLKGKPSVRAEFVEQAGRLLRDHGRDLESDVVQRLMGLWEYMRSSIDPSEETSAILEVGRFSWWCGAEVLDTEWWLEQFQWVLSHSNQIDAAFVALEALPAAAHSDPQAAVDILDRLSRLRTESWLIQGHRDEAASVLATAISSSDARARRAAVRLVHDLGAREVADFSHLLPAASSPE